MNGRAINKSEEAKRFRVTEKSIQRDIEGIRTFLDNQAASEGIPNNLIYDYKMKVYRIEQSDDVKLTNDEILAICKILLASRAFSKEEMNSMIDKIIDFCVPIKNQKVVKKLLISERYHYVELTNKQKILDKMMVLGEAISSQYVIEFDYKGVQGHTNKHRSVEPYAIMFSDFYFYLVGRIRDINPEIAFIAVSFVNTSTFMVLRAFKVQKTLERHKHERVCSLVKPWKHFTHVWGQPTVSELIVKYI
jgi:predicted DNA-binding transcriptional regulator YafY